MNFGGIDDLDKKEEKIPVQTPAESPIIITNFIFEASINTVISTDVIGNINANTVDITVPYGTVISSFTPTISFTGNSINPQSGISQTFLDGVGITYTITGNNGSIKSYVVTLHVALASDKNIISFIFEKSNNTNLLNDEIGIINTNNIDFLVPPETVISNLIPTIIISGNTIYPANNTAQSFLDGVGKLYTVTAADSSTKPYTVTVYKPPLAGNSGLLTFSGITTTSVTVNWTKATDDQTPQANLQYLLYYSTTNNIDTIANIEANGTAVETYTADINTKTVTGLSDTSAYYFNVIVRDQNNNKTAYNMNNQSTLDNIPPVAGNSGVLSFSGVTNNSITVSWTKATDNITPQANLQYLLYYSENSSSVNTVTSIENTGTPVGSYSADISSVTVTGLSDSTTYYFNVIVKDQAGNKTAYSKNSQSTGDGIPPTAGGSGTIDTVAGTNTVVLIWTKATDNVTSQANLQYLVYYSTSNNIDTVANIEANGTASGSYAANITTKNVTGLTDSATYYFNVIVKDEAGNKTAYNMKQQATLDGTPPVAGNSGILTFSNVSSSSITVNWTKATDNVTSQANLQYLAYYSAASNIDTVANIETNGSAIGSYTADINIATLSGLPRLKCYYFNVIVKDEAGNKRAYAMNSTLTLSGVPTLGSPPVTGTLSSAAFNNPARIVIVDSSAYVTDYNNHAIYKVDLSLGAVSVFAGLPGTSGNLDGVGTAARFNYPSGLCSDGTNLYVSEGSGGRLIKIVIATGEVTTIKMTGISSMFGLATDGTNIYIAYYGNSLIYKYVIATGALTLYAGSSPGYVDGVGTAARFNYIQDLCSDGTYLYVSDFLNYRIRKIDLATAEVTTLAGSGTNSSVDGTGTGASFYLPNGIMTDGTYVYVCQYSGRVRKIAIASRIVTTISTTMSTPTDVATEGIKLYVTDDGTNNIRTIQ